MTPRRILATGGAGFIGREVVSSLSAHHAVTLLLPESYGTGRPLPSPLNELRPSLDVVYADLRNRRLTSRALAQAAPDIVIHLAAAGVRDPFLNPNTAISHNLTGTLNLILATFDSGHQVTRLILTRTPGELTAMNVYAASKAAAWSFAQMYARTAGWPIVGAMPFQTYGPHQPETMLVPAAVRAALHGEDFPMTDGRQERDWIHVSDVARGFAAIVDAELTPGETVELGTGQATRVIDIVLRIYDIVGRGGRPLPGRLPNRPGEDPRQVADLRRTKSLVQWEPALSLDDGLRSLIDALILRNSLQQS